jgi:hypothetical protein
VSADESAYSDKTPSCLACGKPLDPVNFEHDDRSLVLCFYCGYLMMREDGKIRAYEAKDLVEVLKTGRRS